MSLTEAIPQQLFSEEEINFVQKSWELVKQNMTSVGFDLFYRFFEAYPEYQKLFKGFGKVPLEQLPGNKRMEAHATSVMYAITQLVDNLDDIELIVEMLKKQARNHANRKVDSTKFDLLGGIFLKLMAEKLGPQLMDERGMQIWSKTYSVIVKVIRETQNNPDEED